MRDQIDVVTIEQAFAPWTTQQPFPATAWTKLAAPPAPTVVSGTSKVTLTFGTPPSSVGTAMQRGTAVYCSTDGTTYTYVGISCGTTYVDTATAGIAYTYKVAARSAAGESPMSPASSSVTPT